MTDSYNVGYSLDALGDLRELYSYIANELLVPETVAVQLGRIRKEVRSLDFMPARYTLVEWEPWHSMKMHQLPVDNFIGKYVIICTLPLKKQAAHQGGTFYFFFLVRNPSGNSFDHGKSRFRSSGFGRGPILRSSSNT